MTLRDFKSQYFGSYLGLLWAFIQPTVTICVFWFIFEVGFKSAPVSGFPFLLWLVIGMAPWFFISDAISTGANSVVSNAFLVQKVVFRVSMLPLVKVLSSLFVHVFFIVIIFVMSLAYRVDLTWCSVQVLYYTFCAFFLIVGLNWLTSSMIIFYKDVGQLVTMFLQIFFWMTPIFWSLNIVPQKYHLLIKMNPICYIISGYRDSLIHNIWFWQHPVYTLYFWSVSGLIFLLGAIVFSRLRPHFADVL
jgi:lipopolysaccharide transport system permease protein/teichoic acid transport system permease protein